MKPKKSLYGKITLSDNKTVAICSLCGGGSSCSCGSCNVCNCNSCDICEKDKAWM